MITQSGYVRADDEELECKDRRIQINSAGYYHFRTRNIGLTLRSEGRSDYQIIYIAKGTGYFVLGNQEQEVKAGTIIFYRPGEKQQYSYSYTEQSEVYWIHFTGYGIEEILGDIRFGEKPIYEIGFHDELTVLWNELIMELQIKRLYYEVIVEGNFIKLLGWMGRGIQEEKQNTTKEYLQKMIEDIHRNSHKPLMIKEYAKAYNMSVCWLINSFKELTGLTPQQYVIQVKINKAKGLLIDTKLNIGEIADIIGFQNAFYFSKMFKKVAGVSPKIWRKEERK